MADCRYKLMALCALSLLLQGCSTLFTIDLKETRREYFEADMLALKAPLGFELTGTLSLDSAIDIAIENNLTIRLARFEEEISSERSIAERLMMLPDLELRHREWHTDELRVINSLNLDTGDVQLANNISEPKDRRTQELTMIWSILDFGLSYVRSRQSAMDAQAKAMRREREIQTLSLDVTRAYWQAVLAETSLKDMEVVMNLLKKQQVFIQEAIKEKRMNAIEGKDLERRLVQLGIDMHNARARIATARYQLSQLMGINPAGAKFTLQAIDAEEYLTTLPDMQTLNTSQIEQFALLNRPELFEEDLKTEIRVSQVHEAILRQMPNLSFEYSRKYDHNPLLRFHYWWEFANRITWSLLEIPSGIFRYRSAQAAVERANAERMAMTMTVVTQLHISLLEYQMQKERFALYDQQMKIDDELTAMATDSYDMGTMSNSEFRRRLLQHLVSKVERDNAFIEMVVAYKRLLTSIGVEPNHWGPSGLQFMAEHHLISVPGAPGIIDNDFIDDIVTGQLNLQQPTQWVMLSSANGNS